MQLIIKILKKFLLLLKKERGEFKNWRQDNGDETLRLNYNLNPSSIVFDVGGYEGKWAQDIYCMYSCNIYIFEPVDIFFKKIKNKFKNSEKIKIYDIGLLNITSEKSIYINNDASSIHKKKGIKKTIKTKNASDFIKENNIEKIDLMKINIEGGEYDLIENLIETNSISKIKNLQIQFHDFIIDATNKRKIIQNNLKKTHRLTYNYDFVWENWELID